MNEALMIRKWFAHQRSVFDGAAVEMVFAELADGTVWAREIRDGLARDWYRYILPETSIAGDYPPPFTG